MRRANGGRIFELILLVFFCFSPVLLAGGFGSLKIFPSPLRPSLGHTHVTFANLPPNAHVEIYTLAGEKVKDLYADMTGTALWDGHNDSGAPAASAVYFCVLHGFGDKKIVRIAVER